MSDGTPFLRVAADRIGAPGSPAKMPFRATNAANWSSIIRIGAKMAVIRRQIARRAVSSHTQRAGKVPSGESRLIRTAGTIGIRPLITVWGTIAILVSYVVMIEPFGFVVSTLIFLVSYQVFLAKCLVKPVKAMKILAIGVFSTLVIYLVFTQVLGLWLPEGSLVLDLI